MSTDAAGLAAKMGYKNVRVMLQGDPGWKKAGYNIFTSEKFVKDGNIVLVDIRSKDAYEAGHIPRAHNISVANLESALENVMKAPIVVYSDSLADSEKAYDQLKKIGAKKAAIWPKAASAWSGKLATGPTPKELAWKRELGKGEVGLAEFMKAVQGADKQAILDVRTDDEVKGGMFPGAIHISLDAIEKRASELPKDKEILIHCTTGARAEMAAKSLQKAGLKSRFLVADVACENGKCEAKD